MSKKKSRTFNLKTMFCLLLFKEDIKMAIHLKFIRKKLHKMEENEKLNKCQLKCSHIINIYNYKKIKVNLAFFQIIK